MFSLRSTKSTLNLLAHCLLNARTNVTSFKIKPVEIYLIYHQQRHYVIDAPHQRISNFKLQSEATLLESLCMLLQK